MNHFDLVLNLLPGIPACPFGRMSDTVYDAGVGLHDVRSYEDPEAIPFFSKDVRSERPIEEHFGSDLFRGHFEPVDLLHGPVPMSEEEFLARLTAYDRMDGEYHYQYSSDAVSVRLFYRMRMMNLFRKDGMAWAEFIDDYMPSGSAVPHAVERTVTEITKEEFEKYCEVLEKGGSDSPTADENAEKAGFEKIFENAAENNVVYEFAVKDAFLHAFYCGNTGVARFVLDEVSCALSDIDDGSTPDGSKAEFWQYALPYSRNRMGFTMDCGMCYLVKLDDGSLFMIDGGEYEQCSEKTTNTLWKLMHDITGTPEGGVIRIAGWFGTHAHDDHMDMFSHLLKLHHDEIRLERMLFNYPDASVYEWSAQGYLMVNRVRKYFPDVKMRKLHIGDRFMLGGVRFTVLQTHEDDTGAHGDENIGGFNDTSTVMKIEMGSGSVLILGDVDHESERLLLEKYTEKTLHADVVQAAHHMINKLCYLYDAVKADYAVVPQTDRCRTNHDRANYEQAARTIPHGNFYFAQNGSDGFRLTDGKMKPFTHRKPENSVYDGSAL